MGKKPELDTDSTSTLLGSLKKRFEKNPARHEGISWEDVEKRLLANPDKLWSLNEMERTDGEPDVVGRNAQTGEVVFFDCSPETPKSRRSICYDHEALESRKEHKPANSAIGMSESMGVEILDEGEYRDLQKLGKFDLKTSSWIKTPPEIRKLGGAIFCDRRYDHVFTYHNGADSYYGVRGFRSSLKV